MCPQGAQEGPLGGSRGPLRGVPGAPEGVPGGSRGGSPEASEWGLEGPGGPPGVSEGPRGVSEAIAKQRKKGVKRTLFPSEAVIIPPAGGY